MFAPLDCLDVEFKTKTIGIEGKKVKMQISDVTGSNRFRGVSRPYYRGAMGFLLCYAINDRRSFEFIECWMGEIRNFASDDVCIVLVGNKSDLTDERVVSTEEGRKLADSHSIKFFETSAKENVNVNEAFQALARDIIEAQSKKKGGNQEVGTQLNLRENNPRVQINRFKCF